MLQLTPYPTRQDLPSAPAYTFRRGDDPDDDAGVPGAADPMRQPHGDVLVLDVGAADDARRKRVPGHRYMNFKSQVGRREPSRDKGGDVLHLDVCSR